MSAMCLVLGLIFKAFTMSIHPLLSSNTEKCTFGVFSPLRITSFTSLSNTSNGIISLSECESATYSLSIVDNVISVCNLGHHMIGQFVYITIYPVLDITGISSSDHLLFQYPANDASTIVSTLLDLSDEYIIP